MTAAKNVAKQGNRAMRLVRPQPEDATTGDELAAGVRAGLDSALADLAPAIAAGIATVMTPTEPATKGGTETWKDWLPADAAEPAELITRDELIARLAAMGAEVNTANLRYWEYVGIVPRAVKRWHDGAVRAVYPAWMGYLVFALRDRQEVGLTLPQIARWIRGNFDRFVATNAADDINDPDTFPTFFATAMIAPELGDFAVRYHRMTGNRIRRVELSCTGTGPDGEPFTLPTMGVGIVDDGAGP